MPDDFYKTPAWATASILRSLGMPTAWSILDPSCGDGAILNVAHDRGHATRGIELNEERGMIARTCGRTGRVVDMRDALSVDTWGAFDAVVMNPPFSLAMQFIERAIAEAKPQGADVVALLRLAFLESEERAEFHRAFPSDIFVLSRRPSFAASLKCKGKTKGAKGCGWRVLQPLAAPREKACPQCGGGVNVTTSDSSAYAWFCWGPCRGGKWAMLDSVAA